MCFVLRRVQLRERRTERLAGLVGAVCGGFGGVHHGTAGEAPPRGEARGGVRAPWLELGLGLGLGLGL